MAADALHEEAGLIPKATWMGACLAAGLALLGCSSSSKGSGSSDGGSCLAAGGPGEPSQACLSCYESKCASQLSAVESGCSDLISCECPGGTFSLSAATSATCQSKADEPSCNGVSTALTNCEFQSCQAECGASTGTCQTLAICCGTLPSGNDQADCNGVANANDQAHCQTKLAAYTDAGTCS
jgi:hypothetical protein